MHSLTPTLTVTDPRGLAVNTVTYYRDVSSIPPETRVTHRVYDSAGRATRHYDPRLFKLLATEPDIAPSLRTVFNLSGEELLNDSVDAGFRLQLPGLAGQSCDSWDGTLTRVHVEYDELVRPIMESVCAVGEVERVRSYFAYGDGSTAFNKRNQCGQLIRQDDCAGTIFFRSFSLNGELLESNRNFLQDIKLPDWPLLWADRDLLNETGSGFTTTFAYGAASQVLYERDSQDNFRAFEYGVSGQVCGINVSVGANGAANDLVREIQYGAFDKVEQQTFANGMVCSALYSPADGRLQELKSQIPGRPALQHLIYRYDPVGNIVSIEDRALSVRYFRNQKIEPVRRFVYDTSYQLIEATGWQVIGGNAGPNLPEFQSPADPSLLENYAETFSYDSAGNLVLQTLRSASGGRTQRMAVSKYSNRALVQKVTGDLPTEAEIVAAYDFNGNKRLLLAEQDLSWDERNRLLKVGQAGSTLSSNAQLYVYDHAGQRLRKTQMSTDARLVRQEVRYLGDLELRSNGSSSLHVINLDARLCNVRVLHRVGESDISFRYVVTDQLGSCCMEVDETGLLISEEVFYAYGNTAWWGGSDRVKASNKTRRFSGRERDSTGLDYYGARYYACWWHRWLSPDPAGVIDGLNLYRMVGNNPLTFIDDEGYTGKNINAGQEGDYADLVSSFSPGDILFGLREPRDQALNALYKVGFKEFSRVPMWKENVPRLFWEKKRNVLKQNDLTDAAFGPTVTAGVYNSNDQIKSELVDADRGIGYKEFAMTNRYFQKDEKGTGNFFEINVPMWRRSSKAGLEYQIFERAKKVFFAIDNLMETLDDIVLKTPGSGTSVTASEIRYVFRRKDTPEVKSNVKFFLADREVTQDEFFNMPAWKNYQPKKTYKHVSTPGRSQMTQH
ncbi:RHS repeat-associated core domain-containing protein [Pseudomonas koreensis]|uniref:RHS repeat-associated core domain-containing protein n=1 Tax=Pseudomonas koreensis TaxID=198620 RepID=UPI002FC8319F